MNQSNQQDHQTGRPPQQQQRVVYVQESDPLKWQPLYRQAPTAQSPVPHAERRTNRLPALVALALLALAAAITLIFWNDILACLGRIRDIGVTTDRGLSGFAVLGVVLVAIVAVVKILTNSNRQD